MASNLMTEADQGWQKSFFFRSCSATRWACSSIPFHERKWHRLQGRLPPDRGYVLEGDNALAMEVMMIDISTSFIASASILWKWSYRLHHITSWKPLTTNPFSWHLSITDMHGPDPWVTIKLVAIQFRIFRAFQPRPERAFS